MKKWLLFFIIILFLINNVNATWWNSNWNYKQEINISNTADNLTNYQIRLDLNTSNVGNNWNWSNNNDIRFRTSLNEELYYWVEYWNTTSNKSMIWINVTSILNNTNTTIYMYYGNSLANSESNGSNTFIQYTSFEEIGIPLNWSTHSGTPDYDNTTHVFHGNESLTGINTSSYVKHPSVIKSGIKIMESWVYFTSWHSTWIYYDDDGTRLSIVGNRKLIIVNGSYIYGNILHNINTWYRLMVISDYDNNFISLYSYDINNNLIDSIVNISNNWIPNNEFLINVKDFCFIDAYRIRKYINPPPTISNIGSEEKQPIEYLSLKFIDKTPKNKVYNNYFWINVSITTNYYSNIDKIKLIVDNNITYYNNSNIYQYNSTTWIFTKNITNQPYKEIKFSARGYSHSGLTDSTEKRTITLIEPKYNTSLGLIQKVIDQILNKENTLMEIIYRIGILVMFMIIIGVIIVIPLNYILSTIKW